MGKQYSLDNNCPLSSIPNIGDVVISSDDECFMLSHPGAESIIVNEGCCNHLTDNLVISDYPYLEFITIEANNTSAINTLANLNSLTVSNNPNLKSFVVEDGLYIKNADGYGGCLNVPSLKLISFNSFIYHIRSSSINNYIYWKSGFC